MDAVTVPWEVEVSPCTHGAVPSTRTGVHELRIRATAAA